MHERKSESEVAQSCLTLSNPMDCSLPGSSVHEIFPGESTGVGCHRLLQRRLSTKELMLLNYAGEDSGESLELQGDQTSQS